MSKGGGLISWDVAEALLQKQPNVMEVNDNDVVNGKVSAYVMQSASQYGGYHSAVVYLYRMVGLQMPLGMSSKFKKYISGQKRTECQEKKNLGLEIEEG